MTYIVGQKFGKRGYSSRCDTSPIKIATVTFSNRTRLSHHNLTKAHPREDNLHRPFNRWQFPSGIRLLTQKSGNSPILHRACTHPLENEHPIVLPNAAIPCWRSSGEVPCRTAQDFTLPTGYHCFTTIQNRSSSRTRDVPFSTVFERLSRSKLRPIPRVHLGLPA